MERECFEKEEIAAQMNSGFVNIKVDREQRPDVDQLYMLAVQILTQQGGWPMSVFLTPDLRPFFGGTYFPPTDGYGRPGFPRILSAIDGAWQNRRGEITDSAGNLLQMLQRLAEPRRASSPIRIDRAWIDELIARSTSDFDSTFGGFGSAPKFPRQTLLELILSTLATKEDPALRQKLRQTLDAMAAGGIRDQLGGAFHRYSTDERWLIPHFEIMTYDNAMLLWIYSEAHLQTPNPIWAAVATGIADFFLAEMTSPEKLFYTALDAEVDAEEGGSYLWTEEQARQAMETAGFAAELIERFSRVYGLSAGPNFSDPHKRGDAPHKNVLFLSDPGPRENPSILDPELAKMRAALYAVRKTRKQPMLDTKILTSWNALMIRGLAHAGAVLRQDRYLQAAAAAADSLLALHRTEDGGLLRETPTQDGRQTLAFLDDYAFLIQALLELNRPGDAKALADQMKNRFADPVSGGFYYTDHQSDDLIVRQKIGSDSPLPSGNAVAAMAMLELGQPQIAAETLRLFASQMEEFGEGASAMVQAALQYVETNEVLEVNPDATSPDRSATPQELAVEVLAIRPQWISATQLELRCALRGRYHVDGSMRLASAPPANVRIPPGNPLQGEFVISLDFPALADRKEVKLTLSYQVCDDNACLPMITRHITVSSP
jgi:uncharacterized protein YyaL (SSP411 family)